MRDNLSELPILLCLIWCGTLLGVIYDLLRLVRIGGKRFATAVADAVFGICFFALVSAVLLFADNGRLRPHYPIAVFASMLLWLSFPGRLIRLLISSLKAGKGGGRSRG